jgi:trans-2,3-dihydro-3-hydroxyanthranilate isomerase
VREDPASGNAAAFLGAYLLEHRVFQVADLDLRVEQGYEIGRPSLVRVRARIDAESFVVHVGGNVFPVASGELV